jgi:hypothetical protein
MASSVIAPGSVIRRLHGPHDRGSDHRADSRDRSQDPGTSSRRHRRRRSRSRRSSRRHRSRSHRRSSTQTRQDLLCRFDQSITPALPPGHQQPQMPSAWELGSLDIPNFYQHYCVDLNLVGDPEIKQKSIERLQSWGVTICQVLYNMTDEEINRIWNIACNVHDDIGGPGIARSFVSQLRSVVVQYIDSPNRSLKSDPQQISSPALAGALESLASATHRLKRKRRPYDRDIESSEDETIFDLGRILNAHQSKIGGLRLIPSSCFGDLKRLHQLSHKADRRVDNRVPFIAQSSIEDWHPSWVGADLSKEKRISLLKHRSLNLGSKGFSSFISNIITFLLSHLAIRQIDLPTIVAYIAILCKLAEERGSSFAIRYHNLLHNQVLDKIRASDRFSLDDYLSSEQDSIIRKLESRQPPALNHQQVRDGDQASFQKLRQDRTIVKDRQKRKLICFKHRPHENIRCSDPECLKSKEHLDTSKPDLLVRYQKASQAAESRKSASKPLLPSNQRR